MAKMKTAPAPRNPAPHRDSAPAPGAPGQDPERRLRELAAQHAELLEQHARLRESQSRLARIFADSPLGYLVLGQDSAVQEASHRATELFACPAGLAGRDLARFLPPRDRARLAEALDEAASTGARQALELRYTPHRSRRLRHLRLSLSRLEDGPDGQALVLAMAEDTTEEAKSRERLLAAKRAVEDTVALRTADLTAANARLRQEVRERTRAEAALRESEERLRTILGAIQAGVLVVDPAARRIVSANPAACRLMGRALEELLGRACQDLACPEQRCPVLDLGQEVSAAECLLRHASGRSIPVLKTVTRMQLDGREHLLECFMDLSERKRVEAAFQGVAESASDAIYLHGITAEGRPGPFLDANPAACRMLGYTREEMQWLSPATLDSPDITPDMWKSVTESLLAHGQALFESVHVTRDGRALPVEIHSRLLGQGGPAMVLSVARDVSARKAAEAEMRRARAEAEAASRAKSEFLANMSHELRTPLNGVMGMLQLLGSTALGPEQRQYADIALQSARGMLALVNDLLDLSRIEAGRMDIRDEPLDLRTLLDSVCQVFFPPAQAKGVTLRCTVFPGLPPGVWGDPVRLRQVLFNLVGNAVKFTARGEVRLEVAGLPGPEGCGPPRLYFSVADTGPGMDEDELARVFLPFVQVDGSATRRFGGAGLGLAITRRLLALMGGRLSVDSTPGQGSEFAFVLPLRQITGALPSASLPRASAESASASRSLRLLLAEDEPVNRLAAKLMLERLGHRVDQAADGREALAALTRQRYDCVLLDISMPVLDGLEVVRRLRALEQETARPHTPVVAMTAHAMAGDRERFLDQGCDGYLAKPVDLDELTRVLAAAAAPAG